MRIAISSGHSTKCQGMEDIINEVEEATRVTNRCAEILREMGHTVWTFSDTSSTDSSTNLNTIVNWHNSLSRDQDCSVHFNAHHHTNEPMGTECLYVSDKGRVIAERVTDATAAVGFKPRGAKFRDDLFVLNKTEMPCVLQEVCFGDSEADVRLYEDRFDDVCRALASGLVGEAVAPGPTPEPPDEEAEAIMDIALNSAIASYSWRDRGVAPPAYMQGFALAYAQVLSAWKAGDVAAVEMARADSGDDDHDALSVYADEYEDLRIDTSVDGIETLRGLYALLLGHGMRESSGKHCCGTDDTAEGASGRPADEIEAGLYQTSYNAHTSCPEFDMVTQDYEDGERDGYLSVFADGVSCDADDWRCYGGGDAYNFQLRCKNEPAYAVETCALVLRHRCNHYGPIVRKETELKADAARMLKDIEDYVLGSGEQPAPDSGFVRREEFEQLEVEVEDLNRRITALENDRKASATVANKKKPPSKKKR